MTAPEFRKALGATLPLTDWTDEMVNARATARRADTLDNTSLRSTLWHLGPDNQPRRAVEVST